MLRAGWVGPPATAPPTLELEDEPVPVPDVGCSEVLDDLVDVVVEADPERVDVVPLDGRVELPPGRLDDVEWVPGVAPTGGLVEGLGFGVGFTVGFGVGRGVASFGGTAPLGAPPEPKENPMTEPAGGVKPSTPTVA